MLVSGCGYVESLKLLAAETGTPWPDQTEAELRDLRIARQAAPDLAQQIADWVHGLHLVMESRKRDLVACANWASENGADSLAEYVLEEIEKIPRAILTPEQTDPRVLAKAYRSSLLSNPEAATRVREFGCRDREDAEEFTRIIVELLVRATHIEQGIAA